MKYSHVNLTLNWALLFNLFLKMTTSFEINDLFFSLEEAQTGAELLDVIEAYVDGNAGN